MVGNDVFRVSNNLRRNGIKHSIDLYVSPGYHYTEYDSVGDELWLVEMVAKVRNGHFLLNVYSNYSSKKNVQLFHIIIF